MSSSTYTNGASSSLSQPLNFKVTHPSQQLARRLRFPTPPTYSTLQAKLVSLWSSSGLTASNLALSYLDSDGDRVVLSSDEELQGLFQELRQRGKEAEVVRMRVMVLGEEGGEGGGAQAEEPMDVEVEANENEQGQAQQAAEVVAASQVVEEATVVERSEDAPMASDDPFADHNQDADFVLVDDAASEERNRREVSSTPFDDDEHLATITTTTPITHEDPPTAMLVDDTEPSIAQPQAQAPDPAVAEDEHVDAVADDPEEVFPPAAEPQAQQPSLLNDLSQLLTSITSSEALATILARAAQGSYSPNLASTASDIPSQVRSQVDHVRDQLTNGLGDAEGLLAGLGKAFKDGLEQVEQVRRERAEREKEAREAEKETREAERETREAEKDQGRAEREKGREEREQARQVRERAREQAQKERELAQEERKRAEEEMREARKKAEDALRKVEEEQQKMRNVAKASTTTTSTFGSNYTATPPPSALRPKPSLHGPRNPYFGLGGPQQPNMFSPPPGPPPPPAPSASLFSSSNHHPLPHPKHNQYSRPHLPHPHLPHPQHRHTWGAPGFPGGGMFGGGGAAAAEDASSSNRLTNLGAKLDEMGFKEGDYGVVLRRVLGEQGGEWRTDEEVVIEVVRELVMGGK